MKSEFHVNKGGEMEEAFNKLKQNLILKNPNIEQEIEVEVMLIQEDIDGVKLRYGWDNSSKYEVEVVLHKNNLTKTLFRKHVKYKAFAEDRMESIIWIDYIVKDLFEKGIYVHIQRYLDVEEYLGSKYNIQLYNYVIDYLDSEEDIYQMFKNIREFRGKKNG